MNYGSFSEVSNDAAFSVIPEPAFRIPAPEFAQTNVEIH